MKLRRLAIPRLQHDAEALRRYTLDVALDYLALGLDPEAAHLFQSDKKAYGRRVRRVAEKSVGG